MAGVGMGYPTGRQGSRGDWRWCTGGGSSEGQGQVGGPSPEVRAKGVSIDAGEPIPEPAPDDLRTCPTGLFPFWQTGPLSLPFI